MIRSSPRLPNIYQQFIHLNKYARFKPELGRRETWEETVSRTTNYLFKDLPINMEKLHNQILNCDVMPSMRVMMTAGPALDKENVCAYNCSYVTLDSPKAFSEILYILMCGTGVGFSCEAKYVNRLSLLPKKFVRSSEIIRVPDTREGWAISFRKYLEGLFKGIIYPVDYSLIRPAGSPLKTMGGRASGPKVLRDLFEYSRKLIVGSKRSRLSSVDCHQLACMIAKCVVTGGVRRSAMISLMDLNDPDSRDLKSGDWYNIAPHLSAANNSAVYNGIPEREIFNSEWEALRTSQSGERGIFNREAAKIQAAKRGLRCPDIDYGINPCSEIILRSRQFCNLTEVVARPWDNLNSLLNKVETATILGTLQSRLTNFNLDVLDPAWKTNSEEERLLGVSLTGIMDHPVLSIPGPKLEFWLKTLNSKAHETNLTWSQILGIERSAAITCVKPSGTVSQLVNSSSGIHPRYSQYYIRRVRVDPMDPIVRMLENNYPVVNVKYGEWKQDTSELIVGNRSYHIPKINVSDFLCNFPGIKIETSRDGSRKIINFPVRSTGGVIRDNVSAIQQLELWKLYDHFWCDHKPSISVYVRESEWEPVKSWVYENFNKISGLSFFPYDGGIYEQAPYTEITEGSYKMEVNNIPEINWNILKYYEIGEFKETFDNFACTSGKCEL